MCTNWNNTAQCVATYTPAGSSVTCARQGQGPQAMLSGGGSGSGGSRSGGSRADSVRAALGPHKLRHPSCREAANPHQQEGGKAVARVLQRVRLGLAAACGMLQ